MVCCIAIPTTIDPTKTVTVANGDPLPPEHTQPSQDQYNKPLKKDESKHPTVSFNLLILHHGTGSNAPNTIGIVNGWLFINHDPMMVPRPLPTAPLDPTNHKTLISIAPPPLCIDLAALVASTYVIPFKYQSQCCNNVTMMIMMKMTTKILTTTTTNDKSLSVYPKLEISAVMKTTASTVTLDCKTHFFSTRLTRNKNYLLSTKATGAPIGMPMEVMMTMTTLLAAPTPNVLPPKWASISAHQLWRHEQ